MVLNVVGSNPTGHPKEQLRKRLLFLCTVVNRTHGFVIDEVAELQRRILRIPRFLNTYSDKETPAPNNETETMHHCTVSVQNTEGKKTAIKRASSVTYYLRTPNASVMRTDFHGLAIDNSRMRLDLDKLLSSVHFNTKLQQNR